ncbi:glucan endo-13-beta-glucosidase7 [Zea mays]|uniref:Glucan endo-13-beta-glucosidase7 n=1 Tax=Zea mays TaxID=4577 RepID=A0A1D6KYX8_MAIZE|nr:glucan endo-13-beta-glucosidase7 [Zea mays]ONM07590.1 glucan endo-13-beta-glucosidase7 [Zea mays]
MMPSEGSWAHRLQQGGLDYHGCQCDPRRRSILLFGASFPDALPARLGCVCNFV